MTQPQLPDQTKIALARFQVSDLEQMLIFYKDYIGLQVVENKGTTAWLSANGEPPYLLDLHENRQALPKPRAAAGLFHLALRVSSRKALAQAVDRLLSKRWPLQGAADHGVSEALYLADPEGNGLEIYTDRPRQQWPMANGSLKMVTDPLDIDGLMAEVEGETLPLALIDPKADIGHMHLQVTDLNKTEAFYHQQLGFDITQRTYFGALFLSAGGYHHHIGTNTWNSAGGPPASEDYLGLRSFAIQLPDEASWMAALERVKLRGYRDYGYALSALTEDQDQIEVELLVSKSALSEAKIAQIMAETTG